MPRGGPVFSSERLCEATGVKIKTPDRRGAPGDRKDGSSYGLTDCGLRRGSKKTDCIFALPAKGSLSAAGAASVGETPVLQYLSGVDGDVIPSEIAKKLSFTRARMSHILDSLETKGYITRRPDPSDRRRVLVSITDKGRDFAAKKNAESVASLSKQLSSLGEHDAKELVRILNKAYSLTYDVDDYLDNL